MMLVRTSEKKTPNDEFGLFNPAFSPHPYTAVSHAKFNPYLLKKVCD